MLTYYATTVGNAIDGFNPAVKLTNKYNETTTLTVSSRTFSNEIEAFGYSQALLDLIHQHNNATLMKAGFKAEEGVPTND